MFEPLVWITLAQHLCVPYNMASQPENYRKSLPLGFCETPHMSLWSYGTIPRIACDFFTGTERNRGGCSGPPPKQGGRGVVGWYPPPPGAFVGEEWIFLFCKAPRIKILTRNWKINETAAQTILGQIRQIHKKIFSQQLHTRSPQNSQHSRIHNKAHTATPPTFGKGF